MSVGKKLEEMEPLYIDGRNLKWTATVKNYAMICSKNQAYNYHMIQICHFWIYTQEK